MSFDIFLQRFEGGDAGRGGGDEARRVLRPFLVPSAEGANRLEHAGSAAEIYGLGDDSMMVNHVGGGLRDVLVDAARAARWTIMPVGSPACVFSQTNNDRRVAESPPGGCPDYRVRRRPPRRDPQELSRQAESGVAH